MLHLLSSQTTLGIGMKTLPAGGPLGHLTPKIFYPKKINATIRNMLCGIPLNPDLFAAWWG